MVTPSRRLCEGIFTPGLKRVHQNFYKFTCREELKTIFKKCLVHLRSIEESSGNICESDMIAELIGTIFKEKVAIVLSESDKKRLCIDNYEKELLSLAILSDNCKAKREFKDCQKVSR